MKKLLSLIIILVAILITSQISARTIYVSLSGSNTNTGNEDSPYQTIQFGIDNSVNGDTILVDSGTYIENISIYNKTIYLNSLYGPDLTTIDGNSSGVCIKIEILIAGNFTLDGFSITNGLGSNGDSGGIDVIGNESNILLTNLKVYSNQTTESGGGIGIHSSNEGSIKVKKSKIYSNECVHMGGGILSIGNNSIVENCLIYDNHTQSDGGGLSVEGKFKMINSTIAGNTIPSGRYGAGMVISAGLDSLLLMNNLFSHNINNNFIDHQIVVFSGKLLLYNNYLNPLDSITWNPAIEFGNIYSEEDPFVDYDNSDFHLSNFSSAIGSGIESVILEGEVFTSPILDMNGIERPTPFNTNPDIGVYENILGEPYFIPTDIVLSNLSVDENSSMGTEVGMLTSIDESPNDTHTYTLVTGEGDTDNDSFTISDDVLLTDEIFDYETQSSYSIRVQTDDGNGGTFSKSFIITVNDVNDSPTDITLNSTAVDENLAIGTEVGIFNSTDEDTGDIHTYSLVTGEGDTDNDSFTITDDRLLTDEVFNYETKSSYTIRVQTDDGNGGNLSKSFIISVNNLNDMTITNISLNNPYCPDDTTGSIEIVIDEFIPPLTFLWSSGQTTQNIYNVSAGIYSVMITDGEGMVLNEQINLEQLPIFDGTEICYLTYDGLFNVVYLDKGSENYNVESYIVYREGSSAGVYDIIGEINSNENYFIDTTINNMTRSYSYKVSMIDKCGNESNLSPNHSTIHLSINSGTNNEVNLYWSPYVGLYTPSYSIYRKYLDEDFVLLEEISSNNNTYTDFPPEDNASYEYYISFEIENTCDTLINTKLNEFIEIKSNYVSLGETVDINGFYNEDLKVYPNPVKDKLFVDFENLPSNVDRILLFNSAGKNVFTSVGRELKSKIIEIPVLYYSPGLYNLHLYTKEGVLQRKVVVVR